MIFILRRGPDVIIHWSVEYGGFPFLLEMLIMPSVLYFRKVNIDIPQGNKKI